MVWCWTAKIRLKSKGYLLPSPKLLCRIIWFEDGGFLKSLEVSTVNIFSHLTQRDSISKKKSSFNDPSSNDRACLSENYGIAVNLNCCSTRAIKCESKGPAAWWNSVDKFS